MKPYCLSIAIGVAMILSGCATTGTSSSRTTTAPAGPVTAQTTAPGVIPAGTTFAVRANEQVNSREPGKTYSAEVAQDIVDQNGKMLVPKGSPAELAVIETNSGGVTGTRTMELALRSVTVNGKRMNVTSDTTEQRGTAGLGKNRRTAEAVGGGAVLGTLLGAIVGGGSGAAAGAVIGAAGGATAQVLTRGSEVRVPAETVLTFRLDQPLHLVA
jgi:hypothetical protein